MSAFETFFSEERVIKILARARVSLATLRGKKHLMQQLSTSDDFNYHAEVKRTADSELNRMMPPRRTWKKLGQVRRKHGLQTINSVARNTKALELTIADALAGHAKAPYVGHLKVFLSKVKAAYDNPDFRFHKPSVKPEVKKVENGETICRPIARYDILDKVLIGQTNKYLTEYFDRAFSGCSFAFRARRRSRSRAAVPNHHDAFAEIIDYRRRFSGIDLYVAECDIKKFFDSVSHSKVRESFNLAARRVERLGGCTCDNRARRLFMRYLESYSFSRNVSPLNRDQRHFRGRNLRNGRYDWVDRDLVALGHYRKPERAHVGIPQGGALSGLIANLILDRADRAVARVGDKDLLYLRYCDDMILIHPKKEVCQRALDAYFACLQSQKLVWHPIADVPYGKGYWASKSKGPFRWGAPESGGIPWIGFVGYEISHEGDVRVRLSSLKKELSKQREIVDEVREAVAHGRQRVSNASVEETIIRRLVGMAVGRVELWNFETIEHDMCWARGFRLITANAYSSSQLKLLDRNRNWLIHKLRRFLEQAATEPPLTAEPRKKRQFLCYGSPFSYHYQVAGRHQPPASR